VTLKQYGGLILIGFSSWFVAAQQVPVPIPDNSVNVTLRSGVSTDLSAASQASVRGEAIAGMLGSKSSVTINSVPHWAGSFKIAGVSYPYSMLGGNPNTASTTLPVAIVPLRFQFSGYLVGGKPLTLLPGPILPTLETSPLWTNSAYNTGTLQFTDAVQRNEFAHVAGWHTLLGTPRVLPPYTIIVPVGKGTVFHTSAGYNAVVNYAFFSSVFNTMLQKSGVKPTEIAVFASRGVYLQPGNENFYYFGFHGANQVAQTPTSSTVQIWVWSSWINPGFFGNPQFQDVFGFSHEFAEAINDPFLTNNVPMYQNPNGSCSNIIEVGDPIEELGNPAYLVTHAGFQYHLTNAAAWQWFVRTSASTINKSYSFPKGALLTAAASLCP
jgi:hypothetical protein